ncbi:unnamed protein product, partial [Didymodactylos carnosus]
MGVQGNPLIMNGGFELGAKSTRDISVPDGWEAGRFWPRTGCRNVNGQFRCATGDCGAGVNNFQMECRGIGGQPPATIAEFTLNGWGGSDYYDLSNVDGHSIAMTMRPIPGQYQMVNNPELGKYNCGSATCTFNMNRCPPELSMEDGNGGRVCASICAAIHNPGQRAKHQHLQNIYNNEDTRSLVCCSCDRNYCVSPHDNVTPGGKCFVERWPRSTDNQRYDQVFKSQCADAYSWQFDDFASTYQCKAANYEIILCPNGETVVNPTPTTAGPNTQSNNCGGAIFDTNMYQCHNNKYLCLKGELACGDNPHACYKPNVTQTKTVDVDFNDEEEEDKSLIIDQSGTYETSNQNSRVYE